MKRFRAAARRLAREIEAFDAGRFEGSIREESSRLGDMLARLDGRANKPEIRADVGALDEAWSTSSELRRLLVRAREYREGVAIARLGRPSPSAPIDAAERQYLDELKIDRARRNPSAREEKRQRFSTLKDQTRASKAREKKARAARDAGLSDLRQSCEAARNDVRQRCAAARENLRLDARATVARERALRADKRDDYAYFVGAAARRAPQGKRYTRAESDSLAEHSVPVQFVEVWRANRGRFDYALEPDARALRFLEWLEENPDEVLSWHQRIEAAQSDEDFARQYEEHARR